MHNIVTSRIIRAIVVSISIPSLSCTVCKAQGKDGAHAITRNSQAGRLSEAFSKAALKATLAIQSGNGTPPDFGTSPLSQPLIDSASAEAQSKAEMLAMQDINGFAYMKLWNNVHRGSRWARIRLEAAQSQDRDGSYADTYLKDPQVVDMQKQEDTCESQIEPALRLRHYTHLAEGCKREQK